MFGVAWDEQTQQRLAEETRLAEEEREKKELELGSQDGRSVIGSAITRRSSSTAGKSGATSHSKGSAVSKLKRAFLGTRLSDKSDDKLRPSSYYAPYSRLSSIFAENNYIISGNSDQLVITGVNRTDESDELSKVDTVEDQPTKPALSKEGQESIALEELEGLKTPQSKPPTFVIHTAPSTPEDPENHTSNDDPPPTTLIQWLDEDSYITRTTTVTYEPRGDPDVNDQVIRTTISANPSPFSTTKGSKLRPSPPIVRPAAPAADDTVPSFSSLVDNWFTALQGSSKAVLPSLPSAKHNNTSGPSRVISSTEAHSPTSTQGFHPVPKAPGFPLKSPKLRVADPDAWKPPHDWGCQSTAELLFPKTNEKQDNPEVNKHDQKNKNVARIQKDIEFIAISSPKRVLSHLAQGCGEPSDTSLHLQGEQDRKRLMLSVLYDMCGATATVADTASQQDQSAICAAGQKILALFESEATASYLAATYSDAAITHLSLSPLPHDLFPNVQPLFAPPNKASISFAADSFNTVYCLSLPSLVPAHEILEVLKQIHRCLAPNGILQLVLLDPFPVARRLGPRTRKWFEKHILSNMQSQSRCVRPSAVFPGFLEEAQLGVREEPCTKTKFLAIPPDPTDVFTEGQQRIQEELRSVVGRMLWQEIWGKMVTGDDNWWDDPECVEECSRLGTFFEFSRIEAVKLTDAEVLGGFSVGC